MTQAGDGDLKGWKSKLSNQNTSSITPKKGTWNVKKYWGVHGS